MIRTEAKAALRQLGYKAAAAKEAVDRACVALGPTTDVAAILAKALELDRGAASSELEVSPAELIRLARNALVQSGFSAPLARRAVAAALRCVGPTAELSELLAEAFRHCGTT